MILFLTAWVITGIYAVGASYLYYRKILPGLARAGLDSGMKLRPGEMFAQVDQYLALLSPDAPRPWFYGILSRARGIVLAAVAAALMGLVGWTLLVVSPRSHAHQRQVHEKVAGGAAVALPMGNPAAPPAPNAQLGAGQPRPPDGGRRGHARGALSSLGTVVFVTAWAFMMIYVLMGNYLYFTKVLPALGRASLDGWPKFLPSSQLEQVDRYLNMLPPDAPRPWYCAILSRVRTLTVAVVLIWALGGAGMILAMSDW
jgi:hypothetical protein